MVLYNKWDHGEFLEQKISHCLFVPCHESSTWNGQRFVCNLPEFSIFPKDNFHFLSVSGRHAVVIVLVSISISVRKYRSQKQLGVRFDLYFPCTVHYWGKSREGLESESQKEELKQKAWRNATYRLSTYGLFSLFSYAS